MRISSPQGVVVLYEEDEPELPPVAVELLIIHMRRTSGDRICTICGRKARDHEDRPWPISCPTLVLLCAGNPVKL